MDVPTLDENFEMDVMDDLHARNPPTLFIKMSDVFAMHQMIASHLPAICRSHEDNRLREIARDLGSAQTNESEMAAGSSEVALSLRGKLHQVEGELTAFSSCWITQINPVRSRCRYQGIVHGNKTLRPLYYPHPSWRAFDGNHGQAHNYGR